MIQITITLDEAGQVQVSGPINDKILCLGLLDLAHNVILNRPAVQESKIVKPNIHVLGKKTS